MTNIFSQQGADEFISRIEKLTPETPSQWGKMTVDQMLAHCNVAYELCYDPEKYPKPKGLMAWFLKKFIKPATVGPKPIKPNQPTASFFKMKERKDFAVEKQRMIDYIRRSRDLGEDHFDGKESHSFGVLTKSQWNTLFAKHLDHHLRQFGV